MRRFIVALFIVFLSLSISSNLIAAPITATATGAEVKVTYEEPSTNVDRTPCTDLAKTTVYFDKGQGPVKGIDVTATKETGGGTILTTFIVPIGNNEEADISIWATASDKNGNESGKSNQVTIRIDFLSPSPPK